MPIVSVRDNKNSRWKRNAKSNKNKTTTPKKKKKKKKKKRNKDKKQQVGTGAIVKRSELNDFDVNLS